MAQHINNPVVVSTSALYTASHVDEYIHLDTRSTSVAVRLPSTALADISTGHTIVIVDVGAFLSTNPASISSNTTDGSSIDGSPSQTLSQDNGAWEYKLYSDNRWRLVGGTQVDSPITPFTVTNNLDGTYDLAGDLVSPNPSVIDTRGASNPYNNALSGLSATNVQAAIDELAGRIGGGGGGSFSFLVRENTGTPSSVLSGSTLSFADDPIIRVALDSLTNTFTHSIRPGELNEVLTTTAGGVSWQPAGVGSGATLRAQGDDAVPRVYDETEDLLTIAGGTLLETTSTAGPSGPIITTNITTGTNGHVMTMVGGAPAWQAPAAAGAFNNFTLAGDSGGGQLIEDGDTLSVLGGTGITTVDSATDTLQVNLDAAISDLNNIPALPGAAGDYILNYDQAGGVFTWETNALLSGLTGANNGLSLDGQTAQLGGVLIKNTTVQCSNGVDDFELDILTSGTVNNAAWKFNGANAHLEVLRSNTNNDKPMLLMDAGDGTYSAPLMRLRGNIAGTTIDEAVLQLETRLPTSTNTNGYFLSCKGDDPNDGDADDLNDVFGIRVDGRVEMNTYGQDYAGRTGNAYSIAVFTSAGILEEIQKPSSDGTFNLQAQVTGGVPTYSWVAA